MKPYFPQECHDFEEYLEYVKAKVNNGWMFRGQANSSWELKHSFERVCEQFLIPKEDKVRVESNMIREFKRRLQHYTQNIPADESNDEWMALMQHYGAPTRLIDFTYSQYVAAYFAFEPAKPPSQVAIWAINYHWCEEHLFNISKRLCSKYDDYRKTRMGNDFNYLFFNRWLENFIVSVTPFRLNERLAYQRGVFLCPSNVEEKFMDCLAAWTEMKELENKIIKFIIPTGRKNTNTIKVLETLDTMNISRVTLFPGLDGFAQSFGPRINSVFLKQWDH